MELNELIHGLEGLSEVDFDNAETRSLNEAVLLVFGWRQDGKDIIDPAGRVRLQAPPVLASIDAALTLVPEKYRDDWCFASAGPRTHGRPVAYLGFSWWSDECDFAGCAATPAIALVIAALRARSAQS